MKLFRRFFKVKITPADERKAVNDAVQIMNRLIRRSVSYNESLAGIQLQKHVMDRLVDRYWQIPGAL